MLRGAAALAVAGVLSPRSGSLFAQVEDEAPTRRPGKRTEAA